MKKIVFTAMTITALACLSATAADTSTITVTANIVASPCTVDTTDLEISLGNIEASTLLTAGQSSPWSAEKTITLSKCPASTTSVDALFVGTADADDENGYNNTIASGAKNVSIQLAKPDGVTYLSNNKYYGSVPVTAGNAVFALKARVFSKNGTAMPGEAGTAVQVSFTYK